MGTGLPDPTISSDFLEELKRNCPDNNSTINNMFNERIARSLTSFDNHYYKTLMRGRGLRVVIDYALDDGTMFL
ncbi:hypothetical protein A4A49_54110 [Nicotiana attenuata]|uniref:Plant heme peroxidase family profile domain-containing protein n=1 Tax=Nicotiana attenuata TaxID=49451 RepID=A0A1J6KPM1_NICAT|nr:hypothetical protein A4A49_54110 [Nicotiana attenuata]